ncbi:MAG: DUF547 domain-containing protein, partial [Desulfocapsaceae bacterium]|nr:DUF547 domain-containing protein [Desulfocapsaceae bacterium]
QFSYASYAAVLSTHVNQDGMVNYKNLVADPEQLDQFYAQLASFSPDSHPALFPSENHELAYWINAYNATVLKGVVEYYPIDSVEDVEHPGILFFFPDKSGFFFFQRFTYGGQETSLYYLENYVIRGRYDDPRFHFALNCASLGCPVLPQVPFLGETLESQLDQETRKFINDPEKVRYDPAAKTLYLSSIFNWYEEDFTGWLKNRSPVEQPSLIDYVLLYLSPEIADLVQQNRSDVIIAYLPYDWGLNDLKQ